MKSSLQQLTTAAETEWLGRWTAGPTENEGAMLMTGAAAPDLVLPDHTVRSAGCRSSGTANRRC